MVSRRKPRLEPEIDVSWKEACVFDGPKLSVEVKGEEEKFQSPCKPVLEPFIWHPISRMDPCGDYPGGLCNKTAPSDAPLFVGLGRSPLRGQCTPEPALSHHAGLLRCSDPQDTGIRPLILQTRAFVHPHLTISGSCSYWSQRSTSCATIRLFLPTKLPNKCRWGEMNTTWIWS